MIGCFGNRFGYGGGWGGGWGGHPFVGAFSGIARMATGAAIGMGCLGMAGLGCGLGWGGGFGGFGMGCFGMPFFNPMMGFGGCGPLMMGGFCGGPIPPFFV